MNYRSLGNSGLRVSELALGGMTFGWHVDENEAHSILDAYVDAGGNFIDTADSYGEGRSEEIIGTWLRKRRAHSRIVLGTKVGLRIGAAPLKSGLSRKRILDSVDDSLSRLGADHIDLYQVHLWDPTTPIEETLAAMDELVRAGKARYVGVSNFSGWQVTKARLLCQVHNLTPIISVQMQYSLIFRQIEWEVLPACRDLGLAILAWSPLAGGWLAGNYAKKDGRPMPGHRISETEPWRIHSWDNLSTATTWRVVDALDNIARSRSRPSAQIALNWLRTREGATIPIIGVRSLEQLEENLGCLEWELGGDEIDQLDEASIVAKPYPYSFAERMIKQHFGLQGESI